jgi:hypothetical protein
MPTARAKHIEQLELRATAALDAEIQRLLLLLYGTTNPAPTALQEFMRSIQETETPNEALRGEGQQRAPAEIDSPP